MLESVRSLTTLFDTPLELPPVAFHLLVMGPELFLAQALPKNGNLTIGRADNADIRITDPLASRLHARLHVGEGGLFEIEDVGSINQTKVRDVALEHGERVAVLPGEAITIGSTILMVQETRATARNRRVWPHTYFEARIEEECSNETRDPFAVMRLAVEGNQPAGTVADAIAPALRTSDMLALFGPSDYELLLPTTPPELGSAIDHDLIGRLRALGIIARTGIASYPRDGQTPETLAARASERLRGIEKPAPSTASSSRTRACAGSTSWRAARRAARSACSSSARPASARTSSRETIHRMSPRAEGAVRAPQLRRPLRDPARERAVRPREGRVHRRDRGQGRAARDRAAAAPCSSTRSATCRSSCRRSSCASSRRASCSASAA